MKTLVQQCRELIIARAGELEVVKNVNGKQFLGSKALDNASRMLNEWILDSRELGERFGYRAFGNEWYINGAIAFFRDADLKKITHNDYSKAMRLLKRTGLMEFSKTDVIYVADMKVWRHWSVLKTSVPALDAIAITPEIAAWRAEVLREEELHAEAMRELVNRYEIDEAVRLDKIFRERFSPLKEGSFYNVTGTNVRYSYRYSASSGRAKAAPVDIDDVESNRTLDSKLPGVSGVTS